jgi:hypothetical protein
MLTLDTEQLARQRAKEERLLKREALLKSAADEIAYREASVVTDGGLCVSNLEQQLGTPISSAELERRLRLMNPRLIFEVSIRFPDRIGIYIEEAPSSFMPVDAVLTKRMVVAYGIGMMPERSVRHVKISQVPDPVFRGHWRDVEEFAGETRGWRTVLYRLLEAGLIERYHIEKYFPANTASKNWQALVN